MLRELGGRANRARRRHGACWFRHRGTKFEPRGGDDAGQHRNSSRWHCDSAGREHPDNTGLDNSGLYSTWVYHWHAEWNSEHNTGVDAVDRSWQHHPTINEPQQFDKHSWSRDAGLALWNSARFGQRIFRLDPEHNQSTG